MLIRLMVCVYSHKYHGVLITMVRRSRNIKMEARSLAACRLCSTYSYQCGSTNSGRITAMSRSGLDFLIFFIKR